MTTPKKMREAPFPSDLLQKILEDAGDNVILVGGQALSFWIDYFDLNWDSGIPFISRDIDFLTKSAADSHVVNRFARMIQGSPHFPSSHAMTALVGQAVKVISNEEYLNIDILHKVLNGTEGVRLRAVKLTLNGNPLRVMHPFDVLSSRLANIYKLKDKQNELGAHQLAASIAVARCELQRAFDDGFSIKSSFQFIVNLAKSDAGKKVAQRWEIHVADAINPNLRASEPNFYELQLPSILSLMSESVRNEFEKSDSKIKKAKPG